MRINSLIFYILSGLCIITSCGKDDDSPNPNPNPGTDPLIKSMRLDIDPSVVPIVRSYTYNSQGKVTGIFNDATGDSLKYEYTGDVIKEIFYHFFLENDTNYFFIKNNLIDTATFSFGETRKMIYDANGFLTKMTIYDEKGEISEVESYTIENGNFTYFERSDGFGNFFESWTYSDFDLSKKSSIGNINYGRPFFGKTSTNVPRKTIYNDGFTDTEYISTITYDASGRVSKVSYYIDTILEYEQTYTYY